MSPPRGDAEARRAVILDAALRVFGQYGYRRTSMDDIAAEAGIGKGTIYLSFASKEEVFQALSQRLAQRMLAGAEAARDRPGTTADKLAAMSAAWFGTYAETIRRSPHAAELLDAKHRLSADLVTDAASRYKRLVRDILTEAAAAGELDLEPAGLTADTAAELLIASARGLQSSAASPAAHQRYLKTLARVMVAGLSSRLPSNAASPRWHEAAGRPSNDGGRRSAASESQAETDGGPPTAG
jgi:AcrR family transcriptional regulator